MKKTAILAALTCAAIASPAAAQEVKAFDGPRAEVLVGYDRVDAGIDGEDFDGNSEDIFYGAAVGYDFQSVGLVFGVEGEVASSGNGSEETIVDGADELTVSLEDGVNLYGGVRIGTVFGNGLIYRFMKPGNIFKLRAGNRGMRFSPERHDARAQGSKLGNGLHNTEAATQSIGTVHFRPGLVTIVRPTAF
ncbi:MAG: outer membrane beta-barrel protein [Halomonas sp.]|nr:outer membrane beta-barrel protein [Halomonas sp.]MBL1266591.1 outer membrane beta-barrel protein [Halomonas sp.]